MLSYATPYTPHPSSRNGHQPPRGSAVSAAPRPRSRRAAYTIAARRCRDSLHCIFIDQVLDSAACRACTFVILTTQISPSSRWGAGGRVCLGPNSRHTTIGYASADLAGCGSANRRVERRRVLRDKSTARTWVRGSPRPLTCRHMVMALASRKLPAPGIVPCRAQVASLSQLAGSKLRAHMAGRSRERMVGRLLSDALPCPCLEAG